MAAVSLTVRSLYANVFLLSGPHGRLMVDSGTLVHAPVLARLLRAFRPDALVVTHAHLDHMGGAFVAGRLGIPVLAHPLEHPELLGEVNAQPYPAGRPAVGAALARMHPRPRRVEALHPGEVVLGWQAVHLPGHTPGQLGLQRDGVLLAADALVSGHAGAHLPRAVYNADHLQARRTVNTIAALDLRAIWPGHGGPLTPEQVRVRARRDD